MIFLNNESLCTNFPIPVPNLHTLIKFSTFVIPRKSSIKIPATYINNTFLIRVRGQAWKLASTTVANGRTHGNEHDSESKQHQFPDDNPMHGNFNETEKESIAPLHATHQHYHQNNLVDKMKAVQSYVIAMEQWNASMLTMCHRNYSPSAANLIHYLALKSLDMEQTKEDGLHSSTGVLNLETINPNVLSTLSARTQMLMITSRSDSIKKNLEFSYPRDELSMMKMAHHNRDSLLGTLEGHKMNHIMVTIGKEAIENDTHIADLIDAGATIFRINCAHGNAEIWSQIIVQVKKSSQLLEKPCRILMDLAGPKLRTGKLKDSSPLIAIISPKWDIIHNVLRPAQVWLCSKGTTPPANASPDFIFHVDGQEFLSNLKVDDIIRFSDARGKQRTFKVSRGYHNYTDTAAGVGFMAECSKNAYVESGTELYMKAKGLLKPLVGFVVDVPPVQQFVRVKIGDLLVISRDSNSNELLEDKSVLPSIHADHVITCESDYLFDSVKRGDRIAFDDGKIWGVIQETRSSQVVVSITHAEPKGTKLGSEKSINIPDSIDSRYKGVSLTSKDLNDLEFVASHADMVGISFIRNVNDVIILRHELEKREFSKLGIILKIETKESHENLPLLILEAMKLCNPLGIMIARGDLAVECGWEKLGDIQEEIISICKASHLPVILATQVLESLVKSGVPTRPEITDAVNGRRASCVMLNKGKYIVKGVTTLEAILNRR